MQKSTPLKVVLQCLFWGAVACDVSREALNSDNPLTIGLCVVLLLVAAANTLRAYWALKPVAKFQGTQIQDISQCMDCIDGKPALYLGHLETCPWCGKPISRQHRNIQIMDAIRVHEVVVARSGGSISINDPLARIIPDFRSKLFRSVN